jgi:glycerate 2-kinase
MQILIVPDKFKGCLTSHEAARAIASGWAKIRPRDKLDLLPMADGGDGFGPVFGNLLNAQKQSCETVDFTGQSMLSSWWHSPATRTAVCESAEVIGFRARRDVNHHPFQFDTYGLGEVLLDIANAGIRRLYIGLGGSATNDGGFGLARSLGWKFLDASASEIIRWTDLQQLVRVEPPAYTLANRGAIPEIIIVGDVLNPLLGPEGATCIYGPQKGLKENEIAKAEACLARLAAVMEGQLDESYSVKPGAGAAGGLGFGLMVFFGGNFQSGAAVFSELAQLKSRIQASDFILTGEGSLDHQTLMGKGVGFLADLASHYGKPCACLAGLNMLDAIAIPWPKFKPYAICPDLASREVSLANANELLALLASQAAMDVLAD